MSTGPVKTLAAQAARSVGRRLRARAAPRRRSHERPEPPQPITPPYVPLPQAPREPGEPELNTDPAADAAELDALRGSLVRELDRLAAADDSSAGFRRA